MKSITRFVSMILVAALCVTTLSFPASAATSVNPDEIKQQIEYYESIKDYAAVEKIVDETFPELFPNSTIQTRSGISPSIVVDILAVYGAGYAGGYAVGEFCKNHDIPYAAGLAALWAGASILNGPFPDPMKAVLALGYDNGYNS